VEKRKEERTETLLCNYCNINVARVTHLSAWLLHRSAALGHRFPSPEHAAALPSSSQARAGRPEATHPTLSREAGQRARPFPFGHQRRALSSRIEFTVFVPPRSNSPCTQFPPPPCVSVAPASAFSLHRNRPIAVAFNLGSPTRRRELPHVDISLRRQSL
jgi:hypothetical protein